MRSYVIEDVPQRNLCGGTSTQNSTEESRGSKKATSTKWPLNADQSRPSRVLA